MLSWLSRILSEAQVDEYEDEHLDPTLTPNNVESALRELSSEWKKIGAMLGIPRETLVRIATDSFDNNYCLSAVILHWMNSNHRCSWDDIVEIVKQLNNEKYTEALLSKISAFKEHLDKQQDESLQGSAVESDVLNHKVSQSDLKDIDKVLSNHCPLRWHEIGLHFNIPKSTLDMINKDEQDTYRKRIVMLSTLINFGVSGTWRELRNVLKKLGENNAADAIKEVHVSLIVSPKVERPKMYDSDQFDDRKEEQLQKKKSTIRELHDLLNVPHDISGKDLINNLNRYIDQANLTKEELTIVVRTLKVLQKCIIESSTILLDWADKLKTDLHTIRNKIHTRQMDLKEIQKQLERKIRILQEQSQWYHKKTFFQRLIAYNIHQEKLQTVGKLNFVQEELQQSSVKDLEWAISDYKAISTTLHHCMGELKAYVEELDQFLVAIIKSWIKCKDIISLKSLAITFAGGGMGSMVGIFVMFPLGLVGMGVGAVVGAASGAFMALEEFDERPHEHEAFKRLANSSRSEKNKIKCEIRVIQKLLNDAEHSLDISWT